jgi:hypothetical protein
LKTKEQDLREREISLREKQEALQAEERKALLEFLMNWNSGRNKF